MAFFTDNGHHSGPPVTDDMIVAAEATIGYRLPRAYLKLLHERNGGIPIRRCFPTTTKTSWAEDHIEISSILGIGSEQGIDGALGSAYLIHEWDYPDVGVVLCDTPSGGHDTVMLDYSACGRCGEPEVIYVDEDRRALRIAATFSDFVDGLIVCDLMRPPNV